MPSNASLVPESPVPAGPSPGAKAHFPPSAPLLRRLAGFAYEGVLLFGLVFATGLIYGVVVGQRSGIAHRPGLMAACFGALGVYFIGFWCRGGQTLAMKTWHLRVVGAGGAPLTPWRALARYLAAWAWLLPPLAIAWLLGSRNLALDLGLPLAWMVLYAASALVLPGRRFWHDLACGTAVVDAPAARPRAG